MQDVEQLVTAARAFLAFTHTAAALDLDLRLRRGRDRLLALYTAATALPSAFDVGADRTDAKRATTAVTPVDFDKDDFYYEVFDPYVEGELVVGSLADDFGDIARDLEAGMAYWDSGDLKNAIWEWSFNFDAHWGDHAVDALRALHRACNPNR